MTDVQLKRYPNVDSVDLPDSLSPRLCQVLARRGVKHAQQLDLSLKGLAHFSALADCERAAARIAVALQQQESICIVGDFDADGATSVSLFMLALQAMGAHNLQFLIPNRFADGYGLSSSLVNVAQQQGAKLIITVDNGMSSHDGVERANALGIDVIITDHHLPSSSLPNAYAIVNPNRGDCTFPSKALAGVGVTFYVLMALRSHFRALDANHPNAAINLTQWLDLVAVGTVADVVPLDYNNRILVQQGVARIRQGVCRPGIRALLNVAKRNLAELEARDLGFTVGPRINAAGRLDDMQLGIDCLLAEAEHESHAAALRLDELNRSRRTIEQSMQKDADAILARFDVQGQALPPILALHEEGWHQGVVGIVAGRLKERFHRPVIAFADAEDGLLKGSARSVPGLHMRDLLERVHSLAPHCIERFGGHAMAAGLTIPKAAYNDFCQILHQVAEQWVEPRMLERVIWSDGELDTSDFELAFVEQLKAIGPWGQKFEAPIFDNEFTVVKVRWMKEVHLKLTLAVPGSQNLVDAVAFNVPNQAWDWQESNRVRLAYQLQENVFNDRRSLQLMIQHLWPL